MKWLRKAWKKVKSWKIPKSVTGIAVIGVGVGVAAIPVPGTEAVGGKIMLGGAGLLLTGLAGKAKRVVKAKKGEKWVALTEHERKALEKLRKNKDKEE